MIGKIVISVLIRELLGGSPKNFFRSSEVLFVSEVWPGSVPTDMMSLPPKYCLVMVAPDMVKRMVPFCVAL